jgi:hypothetical protein
VNGQLHDSILHGIQWGSIAAKIPEIRVLSLPIRGGLCACTMVFDEACSVVGEEEWPVIIAFGSWCGAIAG